MRVEMLLYVAGPPFMPLYTMEELITSANRMLPWPLVCPASILGQMGKRATGRFQTCRFIIIIMR